jgi:hypothetical protein
VQVQPKKELFKLENLGPNAKGSNERGVTTKFWTPDISLARG